MIIYGEVPDRKFDKIAIYSGSIDLYDAKALCMTPKDDPNLIDKTDESAALLNDNEINKMTTDGRKDRWTDSFEV